MQMVPGGQDMSPAARQMQQQFMSRPEMVQKYYELYNAGQLPQPALLAFQELLGAAQKQDQQQQNMPGGSQPMSQQSGMPQMPLGGLHQFQQRQGSSQQGMGAPSPQPSYNASPRMQQPLKPEQIGQMLDEFKAHQGKQKALEAFLGRQDVPPDKREQAEAEMERAKTWINQFQTQLRQNPQLLQVLQNTAARQQQQLQSQNMNMQQLQAQQRQQTASPAMGGSQPLPALQNPNIARARSPSNVPSNAPTPPASQGGRSAASGQTPSQSAKTQQGVPARPGSTAPSSSQGAFNPVVQGSAAIADDISNRVTASRPEQFPNARPTLTQGLASQPAVSTPAITRPPSMLGANQPSSASFIEASKAELNRIVPRKSLRDIVATVDPGTTMDEEVEDLLLEVADEFIESVTKHACALAVHRKGDRLEVKDVQLHLDRVWGINIPGFASDDIRQSQARRLNPPAAQLARAAAVREAQRARRGGTF